MAERPSLSEMLDAVRLHIETEVAPALKNDERLYDQTLAAINVLQIAERELEQRPTHQLLEWERLNAIAALQDYCCPIPAYPSRDLEAKLEARTEVLSERIRAGEYDDEDSRCGLLGHLLMAAREELEIVNPKLLIALDEEDGVIHT